MLSRVADALYWLARYSERTENNAHILGVQLEKMLEESGKEISYKQDWQTVLDICASSSEYEQIYGDIRVRKVVDYLAFSEYNTNSLVKTSNYVRENAKMTRDTIPNELWEVWNEFYLSLNKEKKQEGFSFQEIYYFLQRIQMTIMTAAGMIDSSMPRNKPYHFMKIGKWLERAEKTARILQVLSNRTKNNNQTDFCEYQSQFALQLVHGYEDYSKKYRHKDPQLIIQFLISDRTFPRSIRYCMEHVKKAILEIESEKVAFHSREMFLSIEEMLTSVRNVQVNQLSFEEMGDVISNTLDQCVKFGKTFSTTYYLIEADAKK
ncbi:MAG: alpha-E domain-containing protein [Bacillus sp. (in: firmicutes)]